MNSEQADILDLLSGHTDDTTIERLAFECLLTNMTDDRVVSLMNILGWQGDFNCFAIGGVPSTSLASTSLAIRKAVRDLGGEHVVIGTYGTFLLALACQMGAVTPEVTCTAVMPAFSEDEPLYLSPVRSGVAGASHALRETMFSLQAAPALSTPSRPLRADELLPERALLGDDYAREELYRNVYQVLRGENPDDLDLSDGVHVPEVWQFVGEHGEGAECASEHRALPLEACRRNDRLGCHRSA